MDNNPDYVLIMDRMWKPLITPLIEVGCKEYLLNEFEPNDEICDLHVPEFLALIPSEWHERARVDALKCFAEYGDLLKDSVHVSAVHWIENPDEDERPPVFTFNAFDLEDLQINVQSFCCFNIGIWKDNEFVTYKNKVACATDKDFIPVKEIREMVAVYVENFVTYAGVNLSNWLVESECYFDPAFTLVDCLHAG
jgi:hypothetical protein